MFPILARRYYERFLQEWSACHRLATGVRLLRLRGLQGMVEAHEYVDSRLFRTRIATCYLYHQVEAPYFVPLSAHV